MASDVQFHTAYILSSFLLQHCALGTSRDQVHAVAVALRSAGELLNQYLPQAGNAFLRVWIVYQIVQFVRVVYEIEILLSSAFVEPDVLILPGHNKMVAEIAAAVLTVYELSLIHI